MSTTTIKPIADIALATAAISTLPTQGSSMGALKYNINSMLGWRLGDPTASDIYLYSDLVFSIHGGFYYDLVADSSVPLFKINDTLYVDQTLVSIVSTVMNYGENTLEATTMDVADYKKQYGSSDGLFGMAWFPWNVMGLLDANGNYRVKHYYNSDAIVHCNPMRKEVLYIKIITMLKLIGITFGTYALIKLMIDLSRR